MQTLFISLAAIFGFGLLQAGLLHWVKQSNVNIGVQTALYVLSTFLLFGIFVALLYFFREDKWVVFIVFFGYNIIKICMGMWNASRNSA